MAKKKKSQLKPVVRGFATTSVPKKVVPMEEENGIEPDTVNNTGDASTEADRSIPLVQSESVAVPSNGKIALPVIHDLVLKFQERTEKEVTRCVKGIEYDRRYSKNLSRVEIDTLLRERILEIINNNPNSGFNASQPDESEEKLLSRIGSTFGALRNLGFPEAQVYECLNSISGVEMDEALEWLYLHYTNQQIEDDDPNDNRRETSTLKPGDPLRTPSTPPSPRSISEKQLDQGQKQGQELTKLNRSMASSVVSLVNGATSSESSGNHSTDIFDTHDNEDSDGLFNLLEAMPTEETADNGTVITVRDMALPKHFSGRSPKTILTELITKTDRRATIKYGDMSGHSRAKRVFVYVTWSNGKVEEWRMDNEACYDLQQAENYISTVAMYALTFPPAVGFAGVGQSIIGGQTSFRLLPAVFRNLWDELEEARKGRESNENQGIWAGLREMVVSKLNAKEKATKNTSSQAETTSRNTRTAASRNTESNSEDIIASFAVRQATQAYQMMMAHRMNLPIARYREKIVELLEDSQILVLSGETGCGKSTQVPSFLLEDQLSQGKHCKIICTEPRRISAISLAQRVSQELGEAPGSVGSSSSIVGYSIRLESNTSKNTRLMFVTNGIALRMFEDHSFDEVTHIVIDEVHERSIESDFLLIVLKSLMEHRRDLKIILMSATVDADKIAEYFGGCPTLQVPGRTFPVDTRYLEDAVELTRWSISESSPYATRNDKYNRNPKSKIDWSELHILDVEGGEDIPQQSLRLEQKYSSSTVSTMSMLDERLIPFELIVRLLETICFEDETYIAFSAAILVFLPGLGEIRRLNDTLGDHPLFGSDAFQIYALHSTISNENQSASFDIPPPGVRKIVIATNIAETGITIPDITCVIDSGKHREMRFDEKRQLSRLVETFIARSNAAQRRGRAGRVRAGLCFHLFTKARHDLMLAEHPLPEMMRLSLSDLALRIKIMKVQLGTTIEDVLLRALDPPSAINVQRAVSSLVEVQALTVSEEITPMGRLLSKLPTDVHLGKFLLIAAIFRCLDPALTIAATLNAKSPFLTPFGLEQEAERAKAHFKIENSDFLTIHNAFASWRRASAHPDFIRKFCQQNFLSHQNLQQIEELRQQFLGYLIDSSFIKVDQQLIRELGRAKFQRRRTRFVTIPPEYDSNSENYALLNAALCAGLYPKLLAVDTQAGRQLRTLNNNQNAFIHPSSVNFGKKPADFWTNYLCYFTIMHSKKLYAWEVAPIDDLAIILLCGDCDFKLAADSVIIDKKIKYRLAPQTNIAMKHLRMHLNDNIATQMKGQALTQEQLRWNELAFMVLSRVKLKESDVDGTNIRVH